MTRILARTVEWQRMIPLLSAIAVVAGGGLLFAEVISRAGAPPLRWIAVRPRGPLDRFGLGWLAGSAVLAPAFLGLGLAGLFQPGLLAAAAGLAAVAGSGR